jgi:hypothetical protein
VIDDGVDAAAASSLIQNDDAMTGDVWTTPMSTTHCS